MYFDILRSVENQRYKFILDNLYYIVGKPPTILSKNKCMHALQTKENLSEQE